MNCRVKRFWIDPEKIYLLKFILEGYDGLANLTTLNPEMGEVMLTVPPKREEEALEVLGHIMREFSLER